MTKIKEIRLEPIGYVKRKTRNENVRDRSLTAQVVIKAKHLEALSGIEDYSHLFILFYMHKIPEEQMLTLKVHPRGRADIPLQGCICNPHSSTSKSHRINACSAARTKAKHIGG